MGFEVSLLHAGTLFRIFLVVRRCSLSLLSNCCPSERLYIWKVTTISIASFPRWSRQECGGAWLSGVSGSPLALCHGQECWDVATCHRSHSCLWVKLSHPTFTIFSFLPVVWCYDAQPKLPRLEAYSANIGVEIILCWSGLYALINSECSLWCVVNI